MTSRRMNCAHWFGFAATLGCAASPAVAQCFDVPQTAELSAVFGATNDQFGVSVAISGDTAVVGANTDDTVSGPDAGSVYVFVRQGDVWAFQSQLVAWDGAAGMHFGQSVAIDGNTIVVGNNANGSAAAAYVFTLVSGEWTGEARLHGSGNEFGIAVAISGETIVVGSWRDNTDRGSQAGSAFVFARSNGVWVQQARLTASDGAVEDHFGAAVAISGDTVLVGSPVDDDRGLDSGSAYVFTRTNGAWSQQAKFLASDGGSVDRFGGALGIVGDLAIIGAPYHDIAGAADTGAAYVFRRSGTAWNQERELTAANGRSGDLFGMSVSLSDRNAVVGASGDDERAPNCGAAYVFDDTWSQRAKVSALDAASSDGFGLAARMSGNTILVGAYLHDNAGVIDAGAAYIFDITSLTITHSPEDASACLGRDVSFSVVASGTAPLTYEWRHNEVPIDPTRNLSAVTPTLTLRNVTEDDEGTYDCVVSNPCGIETSDAAVLHISTLVGDLNCDCRVDLTDLAMLLANFGTTCR